ncbi:MAG TPA: b(o/a)3-type cytochrome-c oxidase subunit 1 [Chromatiales bacterium]|nr:b(o/a)3-type cytochrome-c oxidase subunit 1 [Chromatiales bacterium]
MVNSETRGLVLAHFWVAFLAFVAAALLGLYQVAERSGLFPALESNVLYFGSVSTHGVLMGFVLTTFFAMGFGYYCASQSLGRPIWNRGMAWFGFWLSLVGTAMAAVALLSGQASVLYTFYPPLQASPLFYLGATLLVVGSWFWCLEMVMTMRAWKRDNPGKPVPLAMFGNAVNGTLWFVTSLGVALEVLFQLLPWSLGLKETVDVGLARTLFSWTLHAIVYFWLLPAYIALYTLVPKAAGGRLFSDEMARIAFIMLLVFGIPIGFHHLYMDPFQAAGWKFLHMTGTFMVAVPSFLTAFTVTASLELAGRLRGGKGLFGWIAALPWTNPIVLAGILSLLLLSVGGFGGIINASYSMNSLVHNTQWVTGHFHLIFAGTSVIMYFGIAYYVWPRLTGKPLFSERLARVQLWSWAIGMVVLTFPWHALGLQGQPRRISATPYDSPLVATWQLNEILMIVGGIILFISAVLLIVNLAASHGAQGAAEVSGSEFAEPAQPLLRLPGALNGVGFWFVVVAVYMIVSYGYPIAQFFLMETYGAFPWSI